MESHRPASRTLSPLRSPTLQRHLMLDDVDIHYPEQFMGHRSRSFKQLLIGKDGVFRTAVDVRDFQPHEIQVKTVGHTILITASHDEKEDAFGNIERTFSKKYVLPFDLDIQHISSWISKGVLYVKVPPTDNNLEHRVIDVKVLEDDKD